MALADVSDEDVGVSIPGSGTASVHCGTVGVAQVRKAVEPGGIAVGPFGVVVSVVIIVAARVEYGQGGEECQRK